MTVATVELPKRGTLIRREVAEQEMDDGSSVALQNLIDALPCAVLAQFMEWVERTMDHIHLNDACD